VRVGARITAFSVFIIAAEILDYMTWYRQYFTHRCY